MKRLALLAALAVAVLPAAAQAGTITLVGWNSSYTGNLTNNGSTSNNITLGSASMANPGGGLEAYVPNTFEAYCVDLANTTGGNPHTVDVPPSLMSAWNLQGAPSAGGVVASWLYNTYAATIGNNLNRAALALSIWEVLYDNNYDLTNDNGATGFKATADGAVMAQAATYLQNAQNAVTAGQDAYWLKLSNANRDTQDFIGPRVVPEPASMLLLGLGLMGAAGAARRRSSK